MLILLLVIYTASISIGPSLGIPMILVLAALTVLAMLLRSAPVFHAGFLGTMNLACILVAPLAAEWPLSAVIAVGIYIAVVRVSPWLRQSSGWRGWNPPRRWNLALTAIVGLLGFAVVMGWVLLLRPDLSGQVAAVPRASPVALVLFSLAFAVQNSFAEEVVYRGVFMHALETTLGSQRLALALQAVIFGLLHVRGFPSGLSGVIIAGMIGLAFGHLRLRTRGILAPWLAHAIGNTLICLYLVSLAGKMTP